MKKLIFKTITPLLLLLVGVLVLGQGCGCGPTDPMQTYYADSDLDGFGNINNTVQDTQLPQGFSVNSDDCDDTNAAINPDAPELPGNGIDENCNGLIAITFYQDVDGDGFGNPNATEIIEVEIGDDAPNGFSYVTGDCDDQDAQVNAAAPEVAGNDQDDNCDGNSDIFEIYADADGDGFGAGNALPPPATGVNNNLDCDDTNPDIHQFAIEIQDGIDNDCDGEIDEFN